MNQADAKRNFEHDKELLDLLPYPAELTQCIDKYESIVIEGPGTNSQTKSSKLLKCRKFGSHLENENSLLFAHSDFPRRILYEQYKQKNSYTFKDCLILLEETSDLSWLVAITMGWIQLVDCQIYKVQDLEFRRESGLPVQDNVAIPGALSNVSRLFVLLLRMGLLDRLTEIHQLADRIDDSAELNLDEPEKVHLKNDEGFGGTFHRIDVSDFSTLQALKNKYAPQVSLNSTFLKFSNRDCLQVLGLSQVVLPTNL